MVSSTILLSQVFVYIRGSAWRLDQCEIKLLAEACQGWCYFLVHHMRGCIVFGCFSVCDLKVNHWVHNDDPGFQFDELSLEEIKITK